LPGFITGAAAVCPEAGSARPTSRKYRAIFISGDPGTLFPVHAFCPGRNRWI
jgi:hypothetical protein